MPQQSLKILNTSTQTPPLGAWIPSLVCNADGLMFEFDFEDLGSEGEASYRNISRAWNWRTDEDFKYLKAFKTTNVGLWLV